MNKPLYVEPLIHSKDNIDIFMDANLQHFFWDESQYNAIGPFSTEIECKWEMFKYGKELENIQMPEFSTIRPFFMTLLRPFFVTLKQDDLYKFFVEFLEEGE